MSVLDQQTLAVDSRRELTSFLAAFDFLLLGEPHKRFLCGEHLGLLGELGGLPGASGLCKIASSSAKPLAFRLSPGMWQDKQNGNTTSFRGESAGGSSIAHKHERGMSL